MQVDILILTAIKNEHDAVVRTLKAQCTATPLMWTNATQRSYLLFNVNSDKGVVKIALASQMGVGQVNAAIATKDALRDLRPSLVILVGIAGCAVEHKDYDLGDVAIARTIHDYEMAKKQQGTHQPRWTRYHGNATLLSEIETRLPADWAESIKAKRPDLKNLGSRLHFGDVLSGNLVMADKAVRDELISSAANKIVAIEMEAAAVSAAIESNHPNPLFLMIKGFSDRASDDHADGSPTKDQWHDYAALSAATLTGILIRTLLTAEYFQSLAPSRSEDLLLAELQQATKCFLSGFSNLPKYALDIGTSAITDVAKEIASLSALSTIGSRRVLQSPTHYECSLSRGVRYLERASSVFRDAKAIWAISVDLVSTFWQDPTSSPYVRHYLKSQEKSISKGTTKRLFVYSRPEDVHARAELLDWHSTAMQGTYITSLENYESMLKQLLNIDSQIRTRSGQCDFAMLQFEEDSEIHRSVAELTSDCFKIYREGFINANGSGEEDNYRILFSALDTETNGLADGEVSRLYGIANWKKGGWKDLKEWGEVLSTLFAEREADAFHFAGFFPSSPQVHNDLRKKLAKLKYGGIREKGGISDLYEEMGIDVVRLAKRINYDGNAPTDFLSKQALPYSEHNKTPETCILMKFKDKDHLRKFMEAESHGMLRCELIYLLATQDDKMAEEFSRRNLTSFDEFLNLYKSDKEFATLVLKSVNIWRWDLVDDEMIDEMILAPPHRFLMY